MTTLNVSNYLVTALPTKEPDTSSISTLCFTVTTPKGKQFEVSLYKRGGELPHGFEQSNAEADNTGRGYYVEGGLEMGLTDTTSELLDMDGVYFLPKCLTAVLRSLGYSVGDEFLSSPL